MEKIAVIGGGAAGMMASIFAARRGMEAMYMRKMKRQARNYILREKAGAI